jgi:hypothetical protein
MALGLGSNLIVRDGGVPGVVVRLGKPFAQVSRQDEVTLMCGGGASGHPGFLLGPGRRDRRDRVPPLDSPARSGASCG